MNKTLTINISGIIFHIEEDAFEKLNKYLFSIKGYFSKADGCEEIMADIEARIAELLKEKTNAVKQVVVMNDVDDVILVMGKPEDFASDTEEPHAENTKKEEYRSFSNKTRRVFRDEDNKVIGGVCSGIAAYFDIDPLWIRLALVIMLFGFGSGVLLYIILWIIIPMAKTTAEKLEMRGERVDINNISRTVKDGAENFKNRVENFGEEAREFAGRNKNNGNKLIDFIVGVFNAIGKIIMKIVGLIFVLVAILLTIILVGSLLGISSIHNFPVHQVFDSILPNPDQKSLLFLGSILLIGIPAMMMMYKGIKLIFNFKYYNRWLNMSAGVLWLIGVIIFFYIGMNVMHEFSDEGRFKVEYDLIQPKNELLVLNVNTKNKNEMYENYHSAYKGDVKVNNHPLWWKMADKDGDKILVGFATMNIVPSETNNFELYISKFSKGAERKEAIDRAKRINYELIQKDSLISFNDFFTMAFNEKWRGQEVEILLKVPQGKSVYLDESMSSLIYRIENVTDTYDGDMVGKLWKMTPKGLECVACKDLKPSAFDEEDNDETEKIKIDKGQININTEEADVKIDKEGINIHTKGK